ncbi:hypothetical protein ACJMK2_000040 [Sinanodonta woodiana]|uniref:non-specific serine/threonine protein kinase n=1 Tax=Sinanodonta woodiana TaxID=1069815 RepID=A0ABD3XN73_SINWO
MDDNSIQLYQKALDAGKEKVYNIRVMVVGQFGVGKTTLIKRLLGQPVDISERNSTEGIDVHKHCCKISLDKGEWIEPVDDSDQLYILHRLNKLLSVQHQKPDISQEHNIGETIHQREIVEVIYQREITSDIDANYSKHLDKETGTVAVPLSDDKSSNSEKMKDAMMEILCLVNENADKLVKDIEKYAALSIWDFAGQYAFYTTHQTFLTSRAIYLLVIDLSQHVNDLIQDDKCFLDSEGIKLQKVLDLIQIWMNSIHSSVASPEAIVPVILVGTHVDKLSEESRKEAIDKYFIKLRYMLGEKPIIRHLVDDIAIDNTQPDPMLEELKKRIFEVSKQQPRWGEETPARWLPLEQAIMTLKASGTKIVELSLIEEINMSGSVKIEDRDELELFLKFHHEMGTILYFSVEELRKKIILEPQWIIDALKSLITAETFIRQNPAITSKFREFVKTGKLTHELIDIIWSKENNPEFHDNKDHILRLMEQLNIIATPRIFSEEGQVTKEENYFLAPCMLQEKTPEEIISPKPNAQMESSPVLCYVFTGNFLPSAIFHRLLAACIAHWPVAKKKKEHTEENLIFCGCCVFQLDKQHKLTLHFREHVIFLRVTRMGIKDKTPSSNLCIEVREFITRNLLKIIGYLGKGLRFEYFIQCPEYNGVSINSLIPVSELKEEPEVPCEFHDHMIESYTVLDFWFEDQVTSAGPMPSAPISDKDRFMCIAYLLNDVGSKVLRQLLYDMVTPTCTLDQHFANNRRKIDKLLKKKVLNASQMDIMFPPNGDPTNLTDYDITLLSALFNNIMPSLGIQEKNLIKSLRENRNKLYGHTKSCKMNASDFQTCWSDISSTLTTLSQQCVDTKFKNEISVEIQQTQVPDASYLSMIHTLYSRIERLESSKASTSETII